MGLDGVELVMEVEEHFGVELPDDRVADVRTIGDLYELILEQMGVVPTSQSYYEACRGLILQHLKEDLATNFGTDPAQVQPDRLLEALLPLEERRWQWDRLQRESKLTYPDLLPPPRILSIYNYLGGTIAIYIIFALVVILTPLREIFSGFSLGIISGLCFILPAVHFGLVPRIGNHFFSRWKRTFQNILDPLSLRWMISCRGCSC